MIVASFWQDKWPMEKNSYLEHMASRFYTIIILILLVGGYSQAQQAWPLQECIDYAVQNNLGLKKSTIQKMLGKERLQQSKREILPSVSLGGGSGYSFGKSIDPSTNDFVNKQFFSTSFSFGSSITLFNGFAAMNQISYNKLNYLAGIENDKRQKNDIAFQVMGAYFDALFYEGLLQIAQEQKQVSEMNFKQAQSMVEAGIRAKADLLEMKSRMAEEALYVVQAKNSLEASLLQVQQLMNHAYNSNFKVQQPANLLGPGNLVLEKDSVFKVAMQNHPLIKGEKLREQAAKKNLSLAKGNLYPRLGLSGGYSTNYSAQVGEDGINAIGDQFKNNASQYVGLSMSVPIFSRWANRSNVKIAKLNLEQAQTDFDLVIQQLYQEIERNFQDLDALSSEYVQMESQLEAAQLAFQAASKRLGQGLINTIDYYNSKNLLAQAQSNVLRTKLQYEVKKRTIDFFMGIPIYSENNKKN